MNKSGILIGLLAILCFSACAIAEERPQALETIDCTYNESLRKNLPSGLSALQQQAVQVGQEICVASLKVLPGESIAISDRIINFAKAARAEFDNIFPESLFVGASELSQSWYNLITSNTNDYRNFGLIEGVRKQGGMPPTTTGMELKLYADIGSKKTYTFNSAQRDHCLDTVSNSASVSGGKAQDCFDALANWREAVSPFQYFSTHQVLQSNATKIVELQSRWKTFIEKSRYQTPLDVWVTTAVFSNRYKRHHLSGPPPAQLFLLRPALVYEHMPDAEKGNKDDVSVAIEWGGINFWRAGVGFSLTSVYKDRAEQPALGTGVTLHIKNHYSIGYIYRDNGDDSVFFNLNLLEWFGDKEAKYKKYRAYFD